jgi:hypothetical protein
MLSRPQPRPVNDTVHIASQQVTAMIKNRAQDNARKRHLAVDTLGLILAIVITAASVQDRA